MRISLQYFAAIAIVMGWAVGGSCRGAIAQQQETSATASAQVSPGDVTDPVADPGAVVVMGKARFTVLTPQLIRMEWASDGKFEDHASFVFLNRKLPLVPYEHAELEHGHKLVLKTSDLTLTYTPGAGLRSHQDGRFTPENLTIEMTVEGTPVKWRPGLTDDQNLMGTTRTLDGAVGEKTKEPIEEGLISRSGWAVVDDSSRPLFDSADFSFKDGQNSPWPWVMERPAGDRQDWYFFGYGHDYRRALGDYVKVAGRIPVPPRFAFGTWWSRYWDYSDQEIEEIVRGFHENDVPLDVFVIDMGWHISREQLQARGEKDQAGQSLGWTGFSWNKLLFPEPDLFLAKLHGEHLKTSLNLHPASGIQPWEDAYPAMARAMGIDPASRQYIAFDLPDKKFATNYMNLVLRPLEKQGIDFWWLDWQQQKTTKMAGVNPTFWLNYVHFSDQQRQGVRPLLFHRWGGLGNHRYQIGFSGDTVSVWSSLAFQPWFTSTAANVGYAYWSHDIGGHMPGAVDPELMTRWVEFGAFSPILRTHTTKNPDSERRIWVYPEPYSSILRRTFQLRYAMQPYIYTEARRTYDTGVAFLRPLYYDWPEAPEAYANKNEYLFGDEMLVAPIVTAAEKTSGLATERVWLPEGEWIEWPTGKHLSGPVSVDRSFSIEQTSVYLKAGAIVPMEPAMRYTGEKPVDPLIVNVWPLKPGATSKYEVYEDSGASVDYQHGVYASTPIKAAQEGDSLRVEIGPAEGDYPGMLKTRSYEVRLPADWPPASVTVNGTAVAQAGPTGDGGWRFEGNTLTTVIPVAAGSVDQKVTVEVRRTDGLTARRGELDGFAGAMVRLRATYDALNTMSRMTAPPDPLVDAMQTGDRLGYHPERATEEIARFRATISQAQSAVAAMDNQLRQRIDETVRFAVDEHKNMGADNPPSPEAQKQRWLEALSRAERLVGEAGK